MQYSRKKKNEFDIIWHQSVTAAFREISCTTCMNAKYVILPEHRDNTCLYQWHQSCVFRFLFPVFVSFLLLYKNLYSVHILIFKKYFLVLGDLLRLNFTCHWWIDFICWKVSWNLRNYILTISLVGTSNDAVKM